MTDQSNLGLQADSPDTPELCGIVTTPDDASRRIIALEIEVRDLKDRVAALEAPRKVPLYPA